MYTYIHISIYIYYKLDLWHKIKIKHIKHSAFWLSVTASLRSEFLLSAWTNTLLLTRNLSRCTVSGHPGHQQWAVSSLLVYLLQTDASQSAVESISSLWQVLICSWLQYCVCVCVCVMALVEPVIMLLLKLPWALPLSAHRKSDVLTNAHI